MQTTLAKALQDVERLFPIDRYKELEISTGYTKTIYKKNAIFYKLFHSFKGSLHMAMSATPSSNKRSHDGQLQKIATGLKEQIRKHPKNFKVLEIGCGKGYTLYHLAKVFPEVHFTGIDITPAYIEKASEKVKSFKNVEILQMDMDDLDFDANTFQFIYNIESVCHSHQHEKLVGNCYRLLEQKGHFMLFEVFRNRDFNQLSKDEQKALRYVELSVALKKGIKLKDWLNIAKDAGFKLLETHNISDKIVPGLARFHKIATPYYRFSILAKFANLILPKELQIYSIAAYLMKFNMESGVQVYSEITLEK